MRNEMANKPQLKKHRTFFFYILFFLFLALGGSSDILQIAKRRNGHGLGPKMSHDHLRLNAVVDRSPINEGKYGDQMKT